MHRDREGPPRLYGPVARILEVDNFVPLDYIRSSFLRGSYHGNQYREAVSTKIP